MNFAPFVLWQLHRLKMKTQTRRLWVNRAFILRPVWNIWNKKRAQNREIERIFIAATAATAAHNGKRQERSEKFEHHQLSIYESASTAFVIGALCGCRKRTISRVGKKRTVNGLKLNIAKKKMKREKRENEDRTDLSRSFQFLPHSQLSTICKIHKQRKKWSIQCGVGNTMNNMNRRAIKVLLKTCKFSIKAERYLKLKLQQRQRQWESI